MTLEIVVAAYKESLEWLDILPRDRQYRVKVSCSAEGRGGFSCEEIVIRENKGREAGHWLQHIVDRYNSLADWTVFLQGDPFPHMGNNPLCATGLLRILFGKFRPLEHPWAAVGQDRFDHAPPPFPHFPNRLEILEYAWGKGQVPNHPCPFVVGAQFLVAADLVRRLPVTHYARLLQLAGSTKYSLAHELEPIWRQVFA